MGVDASEGDGVNFLETPTPPSPMRVEPSPCAWTGYLPFEGDAHALVRVWGFGTPQPGARDVRRLYSEAVVMALWAAHARPRPYSENK